MGEDDEPIDNISFQEVDLSTVFPFLVQFKRK